MYDVNFLINQEIKAIRKKKNLLKSLLICIDFIVTSKKFSGVDISGTTSKDRSSADQLVLRAHLLKHCRHCDIHPPLPHQTFLDSPLGLLLFKYFFHIALWNQ